ncbi:MAG: glycerol-3-phosphate dehydrogenase/oxidase, partial [Bdellovibrionota bacterium]
ITGASVARDAATRGLSVALVEKSDFASGTSSRSSKLIHGGLRYLESLEFHLVFESLSERAFLLKTVPHLVRPLRFYLPVYSGDKRGMATLNAGLWLYDLLALLRTPEFHRRMSAKELIADIPGLRKTGLKGGFRYYDASMWDDGLVIETMRSSELGKAAVTNYVEAVAPIWDGERIVGCRVRDVLGESPDQDVRAHRVIVCAGPWTDVVGTRMSANWRNWMTPSKGIHLVFDLKRLSAQGAVVMSNPKDGRVTFVMPRPDLGAGVTIVGTTDGPSPGDPAKVAVDFDEVEYLLKLLAEYFPDLKLTRKDILSAYVGVRPLMSPEVSDHSSSGGGVNLQKVSREHHIAEGPGGTVVIAGGKYTTHRKMATEIVDFTLEKWSEAFRAGAHPYYPKRVDEPRTEIPINPNAVTEVVEEMLAKRRQQMEPEIPAELVSRYGAQAEDIVGIELLENDRKRKADPEGFPYLGACLRYAIREGMVIRLEDFYLRRTVLHLARKDGGRPWADVLAQIWAEEMGLSDSVDRDRAATAEKA